MSDFPNDGFPKDGFWNLLTSNMNPGSTSNAQFSGFSSQFPMSPEQQAFLQQQQQQQAFVEFEQNFQSQQQNPPNFSIPQQQSQSSNSLTQTEAQPKRQPQKRPEKKAKTLNRTQPKDTFWYRVLNEFNSELDVMKRAQATYRDENKNTSFTQEDAWELLRNHAKWDVPPPDPVVLTEDEYIPAVNTDELFGPDARTCPPDKQHPGKKTNSDTSVSTEGSSSSSQFGEIMTKKLRL
ncbi:hypothetical protein Tco_1086461 [Tanacetum coccineum]